MYAMSRPTKRGGAKIRHVPDTAISTGNHVHHHPSQNSAGHRAQELQELRLVSERFEAALVV